MVKKDPTNRFQEKFSYPYQLEENKSLMIAHLSPPTPQQTKSTTLKWLSLLLNVLNNMSITTFGGGFIIGFQHAEQFAVMTLAEVFNHLLLFFTSGLTNKSST